MNDFDLRHFAETYIGVALEASNRGLNLNDFYSYIYQEVAKKTGLSEDAIRHLHHPFHWVLFSWDNSHSPLEIAESQKLNGSSGIQVKNPIETSVLVSRVLEKHSVLLGQRLEKAKTFAR